MKVHTNVMFEMVVMGSSFALGLHGIMAEVQPKLAVSQRAVCSGRNAVVRAQPACVAAAWPCGSHATVVRGAYAAQGALRLLYDLVPQHIAEALMEQESDAGASSGVAPREGVRSGPPASGSASHDRQVSCSTGSHHAACRWRQTMHGVLPTCAGKLQACHARGGGAAGRRAAAKRGRSRGPRAGPGGGRTQPNRRGHASGQRRPGKHGRPAGAHVQRAALSGGHRVAAAAGRRVPAQRAEAAGRGGGGGRWGVMDGAAAGEQPAGGLARVGGGALGVVGAEHGPVAAAARRSAGRRAARDRPAGALSFG